MNTTKLNNEQILSNKCTLYIFVSIHSNILTEWWEARVRERKKECVCVVSRGYDGYYYFFFFTTRTRSIPSWRRLTYWSSPSNIYDMYSGRRLQVILVFLPVCVYIGQVYFLHLTVLLMYLPTHIRHSSTYRHQLPTQYMVFLHTSRARTHTHVCRHKRMYV